MEGCKDRPETEPADESHRLPIFSSITGVDTRDIDSIRRKLTMRVVTIEQKDMDPVRVALLGARDSRSAKIVNKV